MLLTVLVLAAIAGAAKITERKESRIKNGAFFETADKVDVLLLGSSHVINGIDPVQLYEDHGIASYNLAGHGSILPVTYWTLVNALDYCTPGWVVIDPFLIEEDYHYVDEITDTRDAVLTENAVGQLHTVLDVFPWSKNKAAAVQDLILDPETRREFRYDFIRYHSRWSALTEDDFKSSRELAAMNGRMGAEMRWNAEPPAQHYALVSPEEDLGRDTAGYEYLRRALDLCREKGIQVLLMNLPYEADPDYQRAANGVQRIADEAGVPYLNLMYAPGLIDTVTDLSSITHLNASGARKVTAFAGEALRSIGVPDRRAQEGYEAWGSLAAGRKDEILRNAAAAPDVYSALSMLQFEELGAAVFINDGSAALYDGNIAHMLSVLAADRDGELPGLTAARETGGAYCFVHDPVTGASQEAYPGRVLEEMPASFGILRFNTVPGIYNVLQMRTPDGEFAEGDNLLLYDEHPKDDVQILLFDAETGAAAGHLFFSYSLR